MTNWQSDLDAFIAETKAFVERLAQSVASPTNTTRRRSGVKF
jgi:hypothetical protein